MIWQLSPLKEKEGGGRDDELAFCNAPRFIGCLETKGSDPCTFQLIYLPPWHLWCTGIRPPFLTFRTANWPKTRGKSKQPFCKVQTSLPVQTHGQEDKR